MKRKNMNPFQYSYAHVKERAEERYGFDLSETDYRELVEAVRKDMVRRCFPKGIPKLQLINQEGTQFTLVVPLGERKVIAVFDTDRSLVTTLLPPEQFAHYLHI